MKAYEEKPEQKSVGRKFITMDGALFALADVTKECVKHGTREVQRMKTG